MRSSPLPILVAFALLNALACGNTEKSSEAGALPSASEDPAMPSAEAPASTGTVTTPPIPSDEAAGGQPAAGDEQPGEDPIAEDEEEPGSEGDPRDAGVEPEPVNDDPAASNELIGWATDPQCGPSGTTGGGDGAPTITVSSGEEFRAAMESDAPAVIELSGTIRFGGDLSARDKTVIGTNDAEISGYISFKSSKNLIFKNIMFKNGDRRGGTDTVEVSGSSCFWFDHCEFVDGTDGNLDIVRGSDLITVSWSKFYYTFGHDHMLSNLCGNENNRPDDVGKVNLTFHHNWWGAGVRSRTPRVRYGKVHVFNNYYKYEPIPGDGGDHSKVAAGQHSKLLVENNYFDGVNAPMIWQSDEGTAEMVERGNVFVDTGSEGLSRGDSFTPPYPYTLHDGSQVKDLVTAGAGRK